MKAKTELKHWAQDELLHAAASGAWQRYWDLSDVEKTPKKERQQHLDALEKQMQRIEKLFGYEPKSFVRGG